MIGMMAHAQRGIGPYGGQPPSARMTGRYSGSIVVASTFFSPHFSTILVMSAWEKYQRCCGQKVKHFSHSLVTTRLSTFGTQRTKNPPGLMCSERAERCSIGLFRCSRTPQRVTASNFRIWADV